MRAYETVSAARSGIGRYLAFYNSRRPHSALDGSTPDAFYFGICSRWNRRRRWQAGLSTAPHALALHMRAASGAVDNPTSAKPHLTKLKFLSKQTGPPQMSHTVFPS